MAHEDELGSFEKHMKEVSAKRATAKPSSYPVQSKVIALAPVSETKSIALEQTNMATTVKTTTATSKAAKTPTKAAAAKPSTNGTAAVQAKKDGLRKPQVKILQLLAKGGVHTRSQIAAKAKVDVAGCTEWIGSTDSAKRQANDVKHFPSLITLGLVKQGTPDEDSGAAVYEATAKGRAAAAKLPKE